MALRDFCRAVMAYQKKTKRVVFTSLSKGVRFTRDNRDEAIGVLRKYVKMDPAVAPAGYDLYRDSFPMDGKIAEKGIGIVADQEFEEGRVKKRVSIDEMIDRSFMLTIGRK
jgi:ABC-type nitrate/sulfonate/bicarbonate transport system substrate-binding protein